jgi:hypothetical protein
LDKIEEHHSRVKVRYRLPSSSAQTMMPITTKSCDPRTIASSVRVGGGSDPSSKRTGQGLVDGQSPLDRF